MPHAGREPGGRLSPWTRRSEPGSTTPMSLHRAATTGRTARALVALVAVAAALVAVPSAAAVATSKPPAPVIGSSFFGVHHQGLHADGPIGWPQAAVGSIRM